MCRVNVVEPAVLALLGGLTLALVGLVPWAALQYRRRGELGLGRALLAFVGVVYALALVTYTLLPLPDAAQVAEICRTPSGPQLRPFAFVADIATEGGLSGPTSVLANPAAAQVVLNVALFVPLGMLVRHLALRGRTIGILVGTAAGFLVSLLVELTQLTGDWFLFPCAYRLFDVDDLIVNTTGALLGTLVSPVLTLFTGRGDDAPDRARPVTLRRRAFGMACDLLTLALTTGALSATTSVGLAVTDVDPDQLGARALLTTATLVAPAGQLALVLATGRTLGEAVVRLRPVPRPGGGQRVVRWALGSGGLATLSAVSFPGSGLLGTGLALAAVVGLVVTRDRRGLANAVARLGVADERDRDRDHCREWDRASDRAAG